ncbi:hypothetical protein GPX89_34210 [Nocardia sp. ET3-3]|uniref:Uncharacterized protein n=1 Tax=Nocardia terrae TaxID=2675851 RepID=A0A7K1V739_9NOCA|nr:hypothetical protein [Nocardia terrae]MVU82279.1 hypothetical protein [Nocardia terrae]
MTGLESAAADLALETKVLKSKMQVHPDDSLIPQINARVSHDQRWSSDGIRPRPETGEVIYRTVAVNDQPDNRWLVTYCMYNSPGAYSTTGNGELSLSDPNLRYTPYRSIVALTGEPSATGEKSPTPRLLVVGNADADFVQRPGQSDDLARQTCEPFMPSPFIQQPPAPLPTGK